MTLVHETECIIMRNLGISFAYKKYYVIIIYLVHQNI